MGTAHHGLRKCRDTGSPRKTSGPWSPAAETVQMPPPSGHRGHCAGCTSARVCRESPLPGWAFPGLRSHTDVPEGQADGSRESKRTASEEHAWQRTWGGHGQELTRRAQTCTPLSAGARAELRLGPQGDGAVSPCASVPQANERCADQGRYRGCLLGGGTRWDTWSGHSGQPVIPRLLESHWVEVGALRHAGTALVAARYPPDSNLPTPLVPSTLSAPLILPGRPCPLLPWY